MTVWWDYGLEAGESYRAQITTELANARVVAPLWCADSVQSRWVGMEAELGKDKLVPARLQKVAPPDAFEAIQAADLTSWDGAVGSPRLQDFVRLICKRLGRASVAPTDMIEDLANLPPVPPLPEIVPAAGPPVAGPAHDYALWERQWERQRAGTDLVALRAMAAEAPGYFANQARARIAEIEAEQRREAETARRTEEQRRAEGRIKVEARIVHGAPDGWFKPGAGKTEWFKDHEHGPEMVVVPAGEFMMGCNDYDSEQPAHKVVIKAPLAVGRFAVTFDESDAAVAARGVKHMPETEWGRGRQPVMRVSWEDAKAYCAWLSEGSSNSQQRTSSLFDAVSSNFAGSSPRLCLSRQRV